MQQCAKCNKAACFNKRFQINEIINNSAVETIAFFNNINSTFFEVTVPKLTMKTNKTMKHNAFIDRKKGQDSSYDKEP